MGVRVIITINNIGDESVLSDEDEDKIMFSQIVWQMKVLGEPQWGCTFEGFE